MSTPLRIRDEIAWVDGIDGRVVVLDLDRLTEPPRLLVEPAAVIWRAVDGLRDKAEIVLAVAAAYSMARSRSAMTCGGSSRAGRAGTGRRVGSAAVVVLDTADVDFACVTAELDPDDDQLLRAPVAEPMLRTTGRVDRLDLAHKGGRLVDLAGPSVPIRSRRRPPEFSAR